MFKIDWEKTSITYQLPEGWHEKMIRLAFSPPESVLTMAFTSSFL